MEEVKLPSLRIPKIWKLLEYGVAKCTPALAVQGAYTWNGNCASWSASSGINGDVRCIGCGGVKYWLPTNKSILSLRLALPASVASKMCPNEAEKKEFYESPYEGISGKDPVKKEIADKILKNLENLPKTGKTYPSFNNKDNKWEDVPEFLYQGKKYVVLTGQPYDNELSKIGDKPVEEGKKYVFEVEKLRVDKEGVFEHPLCVGPLEIEKKPYKGSIQETYFGQHVLPKLEQSLVPSKVDEQMIEQSYLGEKTLTTEDALKQAVENHANSDKGDEANKIRTAVRQKLKGNTH